MRHLMLIAEPGTKYETAVSMCEEMESALGAVVHILIALPEVPE